MYNENSYTCLCQTNDHHASFDLHYTRYHTSFVDMSATKINVTRIINYFLLILPNVVIDDEMQTICIIIRKCLM